MMDYDLSRVWQLPSLGLQFCSITHRLRAVYVLPAGCHHGRTSQMLIKTFWGISEGTIALNVRTEAKTCWKLSWERSACDLSLFWKLLIDPKGKIRAYRRLFAQQLWPGIVRTSTRSCLGNWNLQLLMLTGAVILLLIIMSIIMSTNGRFT